MKHVTTYTEMGRTFEIAYASGRGDADGFWAFEDKDIDEGGRLKRVFNGITGHHRKTLAETIASVSRKIKVDALVADGMDITEAAIKVMMEERSDKE